MGICIFWNFLPIKVPNCHRRKLHAFDNKPSNSSDFYYREHREPCLYLSVTDTVEAMNTLIQEKHNHNKCCITVKVSRRTPKVKIYLAKKCGLAFFSADLRHIFECNVGNEIGMMSKGEGPQKIEFACDIVRIHSHDIQGPDWVQHRWRHEGPIDALPFFYLKAQSWGHYNYWTMNELTDPY